MPSFLASIGITIGTAYILLERSQVAALTRAFGYGLGRSVGMLRNYRQNAEKLVKGDPNQQTGVVSTMRDLDTVAREIRMAVWMARPGAMMRMGPMGGGMGMNLTPPANQSGQMNAPGMGNGGVGHQPGQMLAGGFAASQSPMFSAQQQQQQFQHDDEQQMMAGSNMQASVGQQQHMGGEVYDGGSDILVYGWRNGSERTKVVKRT